MTTLCCLHARPPAKCLLAALSHSILSISLCNKYALHFTGEGSEKLGYLAMTTQQVSGSIQIPDQLVCLFKAHALNHGAKMDEI